MCSAKPEDLRAEATHVRALAHEIGNGYAERVLIELAEEYEARAIAAQNTASGEHPGVTQSKET
jgi:hypothetical protein